MAHRAKHSMVYSSIMRGLPIFLIVVFLFSFSMVWAQYTFNSTITVDPSLPRVYPTNTHEIEEALYWAFCDHDMGNTKIQVAAGEYPGFILYPQSIIENRIVKLVGTKVSGQCQTSIIPRNPYCQEVIGIQYANVPATLIIEDLCIKNGRRGMYILPPIRHGEMGYLLNININRCKFEGNTGWQIESNGPISVTKCIFGYPEMSCTGGILINAVPSEYIALQTGVIKGNTFSGKYSTHIVKVVGSWGSVRVCDIVDNTFDAKFICSGSSSVRRGAVQISEVKILNIMRNVFRISKCNNSSMDLFQLRVFKPVSSGQPLETALNVINNTFLPNGTDKDISAMGIDKIYNSVSILNNAISNLNKAGIEFFDDSASSYSYRVQNNLIHNCGSDILYAGSGSNWTVDGQINGDPRLDTSYRPMWTSTVISPCIDAGNRDTDGDGIPWGSTYGYMTGDPDDADPDGTPLDIGARCARVHKFEDYVMPTGGAIKWMSFPVINNLTVGHNQNGYFFSPILDPNVLDWVMWKRGNGDEIIMKYISGNLFNYNDVVESVSGYKVKLKDDVIQPYTLPMPGFRAPSDTQIQLYKYQVDSTTSNENWIGYFHYSSANPFDAFAQVLDHVTSIRTQYWSMARDPWTGEWGVSTGNRTLNYGDMVIVTVDQDCSFIWNYSVPVDPKVRAMPKTFTYEEKADYTPIYIDMSNLQDFPAELGVYVDGVCKGAVVVEGDFTDVCVYLEDDEVLNDQNTELVLHYSSKSAIGQRRSFRPAEGEISRIHESGLNFYTLQLSDKSEIENITPVTKLHQNYPNPFNPSTTIAYELAADGPVCLEIFNLKGQKVTTLIDKHQAGGEYRLIWDGKDSSSRLVGSGVYYYRLKTENSSFTQKMLLLK